MLNYYSSLDTLTPDNQKAIKKLLPAPLHKPTIKVPMYNVYIYIYIYIHNNPYIYIYIIHDDIYIYIYTYI